MSDNIPPRETIAASQARQEWSTVLNKVFRQEARMLVEKSGVPVAAIISVRDLERFERMEAARAERFRVIDELQSAFADVPEEELQREISRAITDVRAEDRKSAATVG